jgi:hypothetical protein
VEVDLRATRRFTGTRALALFSWFASAACAYGPVDTGFLGAPSSAAGADKLIAYSAEASTADAGANTDASLDAAPFEDSADASPAFDSAEPVDTAPPTAQCALSFPTEMPVCDTCIGQHCCADDNACGSDQACLSVVSCMDRCEISPDAGANPTACLDACAQANPAGANTLAALEQCMESQCQTDCQ